MKIMRVLANFCLSEDSLPLKFQTEMTIYTKCEKDYKRIAIVS